MTPTPETVTHWLERKLWSANTWLEQHGPSAKHPRPQHDIDHRIEDVTMFTYMRGCFAKALEKRAQG